MLSEDVLAQIRRIHIRTRHLVDGSFAGEYHSVFSGRGMEFAEVRDYVPGDDVRAIDWNVTARQGKPFVKQYIEERELTIYLLVDYSASGLFGSVSRLKTEIAAEVAAVLATSALRNNDKVGLILFTDRIEVFAPPQKGRGRARRLILELLSCQPEGRGTDLAGALRFLSQVATRRSVTFVISDFIASDYERPLRLAHHRHDVVPIVISDPREDSLPAVGLVRLEDPETGEQVIIDTDSAAARDSFAAERIRAATAQRRLFASLGLDYIELRTDESPVPALHRFFRRRGERARRR